MVLLVRHAHAGDKRHWQGPDTLRPLSAAGQAEAAGLLVRLEDYPVGWILSSPTVRCQQTVQPLAVDRHLRIESRPALGVAADLAVVLGLLKDLQAQDAVVCTHGEVIGQVLVRLVADGLAVDQPLAWPKGSTWLLDSADRRYAIGRYLPPLPLVDALTPTTAPRGAPANGRRPTGQHGRRHGTTLPSKIR
jgi:8-oxo-dGTP diphosphatase